MEKLASGNIIFLERLTKTTDIFWLGEKVRKELEKHKNKKDTINIELVSRDEMAD